ncbi:TMEM175 family protein [Lactococcus insecticola]|uniref:Ferrochelatase n=1 Tax=Pseudolactococcus insecticola TaxID=2709158 RepID=A0A6A0B8K9_9LACT|nr:TMEM175 family protein [Lactococcus insecticola]GFH40167.1 ferrochelatase [Lactococcus insecticola]
MTKTRLTLFTDAVVAIIITILVLEFPHIKGNKFSDLLVLKDVFLAYVVSFVFLIIYWTNHHHIFQLIDKVSGKTLWLNNAFIFLMSLFPFATNWLGENIFARDPEMLYAALFLVINGVWLLMIKNLVKVNHHNAHVAEILGDYKKSYHTLMLNALAFIIAIFIPIAGLIVNIISFLLWVIPDKRIEHAKK